MNKYLSSLYLSLLLCTPFQAAELKEDSIQQEAIAHLKQADKQRSDGEPVEFMYTQEELKMMELGRTGDLELSRLIYNRTGEGNGRLNYII